MTDTKSVVSADAANPPGSIILTTGGVERARIASDGTPTGLLAGARLVGSDLTERSTAATGNDAANLSSVSGLNIPAGTPVLILFRFRKSAGAAAAAKLGLKINATVVAGTAISGAGATGAQNEAQSGLYWGQLLPGATNYTAALQAAAQCGGASGGVSAFAPNGAVLTNPVPIAAITSITITGDAVNAAQTLFTDQLRVFTLPIA